MPKKVHSLGRRQRHLDDVRPTKDGWILGDIVAFSEGSAPEFQQTKPGPQR